MVGPMGQSRGVERSVVELPDQRPETNEAPALAERSGRAPDRGGGRSGLVALLALVLGVGIVMVVQQVQALGIGEPAPEPAAIEPVDPGDPVLLTAKMGLKLYGVMDRLSETSPGEADPSVVADAILPQVTEGAGRPEEQIRAAIVAMELGKPSEAIRLTGLASEGLADAPDDRIVLRQDAAWVRGLAEHRSDAGAAPEGLVERHGWYGELALTSGLDRDDPARAGFFDGGVRLMVTLFAFGATIGLAVLVGFVLLIVGVVKMASGSGRLRPRFVPPAPGGSVYLETAALFVWGFFLLQAVMGVVAGVGLLSGSAVFYASMAGQWLLLPIIAWPLARGTSLSAWREQVGLVAPRGWWREIVSGVVAYLAMLPVYVVIAIVSALMLIVWQMLVAGGEDGGGGASNPIIEIVSGASPLGLLLFLSLATVWAPVVEEFVFRGSLFRHLRSRLAFPLAAILSAAAFGLMHGYHFIMLTPVIMLGVVFAVVREWRGSIVGAIAAHALHNGTLLGFVTLIFAAIG